VRATLLLCDGVHVIDGKLFVLGWGWTHTGPDPTPQAVAGRIELENADFGKAHHVEIFLEDEAGQTATIPAQDGTPQPLELRQDFEVPQLDELAEGTIVTMPLAFNLPPLPLQPDTKYIWKMMIDGESEDTWQVTFRTRPQAPGAAG
jgi:hypothetical protein